MGILKAAFTSADTLMDDQFKEYFYCDALPGGTMLQRASRRQTDRGGNTESSQDLISDGSIIVVPDGMAAIVTENGKVIAAYAEPGENVFETDRVPSIFSRRKKGQFRGAFMERLAFGGDVPVVQRVYYISTREQTGVPFAVSGAACRMRDDKATIDIDGSIACSGVFSFRVVDAGKFYKIAHINRYGETKSESLTQTMQTELQTQFQAAIGALTRQGLRPSQLPQHTRELCDALNDTLSNGWAGERGLGIVSVAISSLTVEDSAHQIIHEMQSESRLTDPTRIAAHLGAAAADAMEAAAANPTAGAAVVAAPVPQPAAPAGAWKCRCGAHNSGRFCTECGSPRPEEWVCTCGTKNKSNFCTACGRPRP